MQPKKLSPRKATTEKKLCSLKSDGHQTKKYWIQLGTNHVSITAQESGKQPTGKLWEIPRRDFNALIDWYNKKQILTTNRSHER